MAKQILEPLALKRLHEQERILRTGDWGDGRESVGLMRALVPGAEGPRDCVASGWPEWLVYVVADLHHGDFEWCIDSYWGLLECPDQETKRQAAFSWAYDIATAVTVPTDYEAAHCAFMSKLLERCVPHDPDGSVASVATLWQRRGRGEDVDCELRDLHAAAKAQLMGLYRAEDEPPNIWWVAYHASNPLESAHSVAGYRARDVFGDLAAADDGAKPCERRRAGCLAVHQEYARQRHDLVASLRAGQLG